MSGHRRDVQGPAGRLDGDGRLLLVLSEQEPRRIRRWRVGDDGGCVARARGEAAQKSRFGDEVLPPEGRWQLPAGCAAGGDPAREVAAPAGVDGDAPRERGAVPPSLRRDPDRRGRRAADRARGQISHLQPVRHPRSETRSGARASDRALASAPKSITPFRSTCRSVLRRSAIGVAIFLPRNPPPNRRWPCLSTASSPSLSRSSSCGHSARRSHGRGPGVERVSVESKHDAGDGDRRGRPARLDHRLQVVEDVRRHRLHANRARSRRRGCSSRENRELRSRTSSSTAQPTTMSRPQRMPRQPR